VHGCLLAIALALGASNPHLVKARALFDEMNADEAAEALEKAWASNNLSRPEVIEILELQGVIAASLGQAPKARKFFRKLLVIDPEHRLAGTFLGPKVTAIFDDEKVRLPIAGSLQFGELSEVNNRQLVVSIGARVMADPIKLGRTVRFHVQAADGSFEPHDVSLESGRASFEVNVPQVSWWAELLGDKNRVLAVAGSAAEPHVSKRAPANYEPTDPDMPGARKAAPSDSGPVLRYAAYGLAGAGVLAIGGGVLFGLQSSSARAQIDSASRDDAGRVNGLTRVQALDLQGKAIQSATLANVCYVGGLALAGAGVGLYLMTGDEKVALLPAPGGVVLTGVFP
jgi:hypothetical protein